MLFIPDVEGDLVNLEQCATVYIHEAGDTVQVIAQRDGSKIDGANVLYQGSLEQCEVFRTDLRRVLEERKVLILLGTHYG